MSRCLLFVYGLLKPGYQPPRTMVRSWPDSVRGALYDLGPYPGAVEIDVAESSFEGVVVELEESELQRLDVFEEVHSGQYVRKRVMTAGGHEVWIYEYARPLPTRAKRIDRWT